MEDALSGGDGEMDHPGVEGKRKMCFGCSKMGLSSFCLSWLVDLAGYRGYIEKRRNPRVVDRLRVQARVTMVGSMSMMWNMICRSCISLFVELVELCVKWSYVGWSFQSERIELSFLFRHSIPFFRRSVSVVYVEEGRQLLTS
jgi:hypothetical protein